MGVLFSKRHDFLTYEKSLEQLGQLQGKLVLRRGRRKAALQGCKQQLLTACFISLLPCLAWVAYRRQGHWDHFSATAYFTGTASPFIIPVVLYAMSYIIYQLLLLVDRHEEKHLKKLAEAKKKLIKELKDSTNFEKTMALLKKYDPEVQLPAAPAVSAQGLRQRNLKSNVGALTHSAGAKAPGTLLSSALDSVSALATNLMGDNPTLLEELRKAHTTAQKLQEENDMLRQQLQQLCIKYDEVPVLVDVSSGGTAQGTAAAATEQEATQGAKGATSSQPTPSQQSQTVGKDPAAPSSKGASDKMEAGTAAGLNEAPSRSKGMKKEPSSSKS